MQTLETRLPDLDDAKPQYEPETEDDSDEDTDEEDDSEPKPTIANRQVLLVMQTGIFTGWGPRTLSHGGLNTN